MRREVQVHFENMGQLAWHEDIEDATDWLSNLLETPQYMAYDEDTGRHMLFQMKHVTAVILVNKVVQPDTDLFRRNYATSEG